MNITINSNDELIKLCEQYGVKVASPVKRLLVTIIEDANKKGEEEAIIYVPTSFMPISYSQVPAMLARTMAKDVSYLSVQATVEGDYLKITAADEKQPHTFRARAIHALLDTGRFVCPRSTIPKTYRQRPKLLAHYLRDEIAGKIATIAKRKRIIWKLTTITE